MGVSGRLTLHVKVDPVGQFFLQRGDASTATPYAILRMASAVHPTIHAPPLQYSVTLAERGRETKRSNLDFRRGRLVNPEFWISFATYPAVDMDKVAKTTWSGETLLPQPHELVYSGNWLSLPIIHLAEEPTEIELPVRGARPELRGCVWAYCNGGSGVMAAK